MWSGDQCSLFWAIHILTEEESVPHVNSFAHIFLFQLSFVLRLERDVTWDVWMTK